MTINPIKIGLPEGGAGLGSNSGRVTRILLQQRVPFHPHGAHERKPPHMAAVENP